MIENQLLSGLDYPISPLKEILAYEYLWANEKASFKKLADMFRDGPSARLSSYVNDIQVATISNEIKKLITEANNHYQVDVLINNTCDFPDQLHDAKDPIPLLYFSGNLGYLQSRRVAIVGTRKPTEAGVRRARKLTKLFVSHDFTIVSGLAQGIDSAAHTTTLECSGRTIAVLGTPINQFYPKENVELQIAIAKNHLLVSQVPLFQYLKQSIRGNRLFFPERNKTMSALTEATIIVEASDTSGTLVQAKAALDQGRKLFILNNCFENKSISWPVKFESKGAIRIREFEEIIEYLG